MPSIRFLFTGMTLNILYPLHLAPKEHIDQLILSNVCRC